MGTRADFYIGTGNNAEWLGSVAWDGYQWDEYDNGKGECALMSAIYEEEFRAAVEEIKKERDDFTSPEQGWPWPWETSDTTDYVYYLNRGKVKAKTWGGGLKWPNMKDRQNVTFGKRSGVMLITT